MHVINVIHKSTGEIISIYNHEWATRGKELQVLSQNGELLCRECKKTVEVTLDPYPRIPFLFVCHSELDHLDISNPDSPEQDFFGKGELDYYDPEKFEDEDY